MFHFLNPASKYVSFNIIVIFLFLILIQGCGSGDDENNSLDQTDLATKNSSPSASNIRFVVEGQENPIAGNTVTAQYDYSDTEGDEEDGTLIRWLRNDLEIVGESSLSYTIKNQDIGKNIRFEITPIAASGNAIGSVVSSSDITIASNVFSEVFITDDNEGELMVNDGLTATYTLHSSIDSSNLKFNFQWYRNDRAISDATTTSYVLTELDLNSNLSFVITPIDTDLSYEISIYSSVSSSNLFINSLSAESDASQLTEELSHAEYLGLSPVKQFQVSNKLAASLFKGVSVSDFFHLGSLNSDLSTSDTGENFIDSVKNMLQINLEDKEDFLRLVERRHTLVDKEKQENNNLLLKTSLAKIREFPISRDFFEIWMAYTLAKTNLFYPSEEFNAVSHNDQVTIHTNLIRDMNADLSVQTIVLNYMRSPENWRRFSSPQTNTNAMMELFLGIIATDKTLTKASQACKNWVSTDENSDLELQIDLDITPNTEKLSLLGTEITTCEDFYNSIINHPLFMPNIITKLVNLFFPSIPDSLKQKIVFEIDSQNPIHFREIFNRILFSKVYLLNNERPKSFEETFFNIVDRIQWRNKTEFLTLLSNRDKNPYAPALQLSNRTAIRGRLLHVSDDDSPWGHWNSTFVSQGDYYKQKVFIDFVFLSLLSRTASETEKENLIAEFEEKDVTEDRISQTRIMFDNISQLTEFYYFDKVVN